MLDNDQPEVGNFSGFGFYASIIADDKKWIDLNIWRFQKVLSTCVKLVVNYLSVYSLNGKCTYSVGSLNFFYQLSFGLLRLVTLSW